jgi:hypothetical protein
MFARAGTRWLRVLHCVVVVVVAGFDWLPRQIAGVKEMLAGIEERLTKMELSVNLAFRTRHMRVERLGRLLRDLAQVSEREGTRGCLPACFCVCVLGWACHAYLLVRYCRDGGTGLRA